MEQRDIIIITDFEEGHLYPLLSLAKNFEEAGFSVSFVGILDTSMLIEKNGFDCIPIFKKVFPKGYVKKLKNNNLSSASISSDLYMLSLFDEFDEIIPIVKPKIVFSSLFFSLAALLIHYKYGVKQIIFHTLFPPLSINSDISMGQMAADVAAQTFLELDGQEIDYFMNFLDKRNLNINKFEDLTAPLREMPQVTLCPKELNVRNYKVIKNEIYLGPCINLSKDDENDFLQSMLQRKGNRKIIYASMGSQTKEYPKKAEVFFNIVIESMKSEYFKDFHLILSVGSNIENWNLAEIPENVDVYSWVPQIEILKIASAAIIHGGLGSIKECIYFGVPMLIIPMGRDQDDNAVRVEHHKIGYTITFDLMTKQLLDDKLQKLIVNQEVIENLSRMQYIFHKTENEKNEVNFVQRLI